MSDHEAYLKGYEDAMRAASAGGPVSLDAEAGTSSSTGGSAGTSSPTTGSRVQEAIGTAFGWLILFPVLFALMGGAVGWLITGEHFEAYALFWFIVTFCFALFVGMVKVGFELLVRLWPVVILAIVVVIILRQVG
jgi:hypothetical protein